MHGDPNRPLSIEATWYLEGMGAKSYKGRLLYVSTVGSGRASVYFDLNGADEIRHRFSLRGALYPECLGPIQSLKK